VAAKENADLGVGVFAWGMEILVVRYRPNPDLEQAQLDGGHISLSSDSTYGFKNL
jgi:hypothetical protein